MAENIRATSWTAHVDIRCKYVKRYVESSKVKMIFVKSEDNEEKFLQKNLSRELHPMH